MKIGIICNQEKEGIVELKEATKKWYQENGVTVVEDFLSNPQDSLDFVIVLGGDGTILSTIKKMYPQDYSLLGVNAGRLGFLTSIEQQNLEAYYKKTVEKDYYIENRMMLEIAILRQGKVVFEDIALNDVVLSRGSLSRILNFKTLASENLVGDFFADGFIVATPTGSTAYSLSAGGPILTPKMRAFVLTPICPHTTSARPMVVDRDEIIKIMLNEDYEENIVTIDGQRRTMLSLGDELIIKESKTTGNIIQFKNRNFFKILGEKIGYRK